MCLCLTCNDKPGNHNFELVLPPGSVLRAELPGRPTRDCLSAGPARDGTSLLEIWNVSKCAGVVAVLNCQGAGWCRVTKMTRVHDAAPGDAHVDRPRRGRGRDRRPRRRGLGRRVRLPVGGAHQAAQGRHAAGDAQGPRVRAVPRLPREGGGGDGRLVRARVGLLDMSNSGGAVEEREAPTARGGRRGARWTRRRWSSATTPTRTGL
ncbi:hypothetical protein SEVIR_4G153400v4 [Setaria viridis]|uniref:Uncharacterized protein n=1 Tax=Setaria viridis TaxID=4556 RepID=A0A4U6UYU3_SETVI|nr:hypothetical protein SEVIR_4G153400v2 [Setaria viridis]